ncbi:MAG: hypothetical protein QOK37_3676 [Thermoanaerobaculia bacterium]|jgi:hypothetical protein|nr:hypothetical protein [Thermoanaerobaculia bacterium]
MNVPLQATRGIARIVFSLLAMMILTTSMAADPASVIWKTKGSMTFMAADGADVWVIEASGGLEAPKASLVRIGATGATRIATFSGYAYSPAADGESVYLVVGKDIVRVGKRPPYATTILKKGEVWPIGTAVDGESVYFANQSTEGLVGGPPDGKPGSVAKISKGGAGLVRLTEANTRELVLDTNNVYFSNGTNICAVSKRGGPIRTLVQDTGQTPSLAVEGEWLVYTRSDGVSRVNTKSGRIETLADDIDIPLVVAAADGVAYVGGNMAFQGPGKPPKPAEVLRLRAGGAPERLWSGMTRLISLVIASGKLYVAVEPMDGSDGSSLLRIDPPAMSR